MNKVQLRTATTLSTPTDQRVPAPPAGKSPFDAIRRVRPDGSEYWSARDMQPLMGYPRWQDYQRPIERAIATARNTGMDIEAHFRGSPENSSTRGGRPRKDFELSRDAAYLVAMNGDPNKKQVAAAQLYFAAKTREAELAAVGKIIQPAVDDDLDVIEGMVRAIRADRQRLAAVEQAQAATAAKVAAIEGHYDEYTALAYAKLHDYPTGRPYLAKVGKHATALMREQGAEPHRRQDATFGAINVYPVSVLECAFAEVTR